MCRFFQIPKAYCSSICRHYAITRIYFSLKLVLSRLSNGNSISQHPQTFFFISAYLHICYEVDEICSLPSSIIFNFNMGAQSSQNPLPSFIPSTRISRPWAILTKPSNNPVQQAMYGGLSSNKEKAPFFPNRFQHTSSSQEPIISMAPPNSSNTTKVFNVLLNESCNLGYHLNVILYFTHENAGSCSFGLPTTCQQQTTVFWTLVLSSKLFFYDMYQNQNLFMHHPK